MILKAILCVQHYCSFGAIVFNLHLLIKTDSTIICVPCMLEHVCDQCTFTAKQLFEFWLTTGDILSLKTDIA